MRDLASVVWSYEKCIDKCSCIVSMQVLYKPFEAISFKPFEAIPFKFHINTYICAWEKIGGHVNDLGSKSCCHQSGKILTFHHDELRIAHQITTKLGRYIPLVMVMNLLILLEIFFFFCQIFFSKFWFCFFYDQTFHWSHLRNGWDDWCEMNSWCIEMGAGPTVTLTYDLDHGFFKSKFEIPLHQECEGQLTLNDLGIWVGEKLDPLYDLELWPWPRIFKVIFWNSRIRIRFVNWHWISGYSSSYFKIAVWNVWSAWFET